MLYSHLCFEHFWLKCKEPITSTEQYMYVFLRHLHLLSIQLNILSDPIGQALWHDHQFDTDFFTKKRERQEVRSQE
jgi:hypothetical protein